MVGGNSYNYSMRKAMNTKIKVYSHDENNMSSSITNIANLAKLLCAAPCCAMENLLKFTVNHSHQSLGPVATFQPSHSCHELPGG
jgi:hypothetical protein